MGTMFRDGDTRSESQAPAKGVMALAATIAAGTPAYADAVRFDNDGSFDWYFTTLDLTLSAQDQTLGTTADVTGTSIYLDYFGDFYPTFTYQHAYTGGLGAEIFNGGFSNRYASPFDAGDLIGPGLVGGAFSQSSSLEFSFYACDYYDPDDCYSGNRGLLPIDGTPTYIGVRLDIGGMDHYGWIGLTNNGGGSISVFAWGYETTANTAIGAGVPSPGALGALAIGAVGLLGRRTRADA